MEKVDKLLEEYRFECIRRNDGRLESLKRVNFTLTRDRVIRELKRNLSRELYREVRGQANNEVMCMVV